MTDAEEPSFWPRTWAWIRQHPWWIALGALYVLVWWFVPLVLYRHTGTDKEAKLTAITDTRTALLAGLIGVGALLTLWLNSRVYRISAEALRVTEQGQITERYTKAIEQLGSDKLDVRLGGIYALESIAHDSDEDRGYREHRTIVEVLSAFVREHSDPAHTDSEPLVAEPAAERSSDAGLPPREPKPMTDVRAALTVLGRLPFRPDIDRADLSDAYFADAGLYGANLSGFSFIGANLQSANLREANLQSANLREANLQGARLQGANLPGGGPPRGGPRRGEAARGESAEGGPRGGVLGESEASGGGPKWCQATGSASPGSEPAGGAPTGSESAEGVPRGGGPRGGGSRGRQAVWADLTNVRGLTRAQLQLAVVDSETRLPPELQEPNGTAASDSA